MSGLSKMPRAEQWADRISAQLGKTVESIIGVGRLLVKAKEDLPHGEWGRMFEDKLIPISQRSANCYMAIASNRVLSDSQHVANLPQSWGTLYELTRVPDPILKNALRDDVITPDMERQQVKALIPIRPASSGNGRQRVEVEDDDEPYRDVTPTPKEYEEAFLMRASTARDFAEQEYLGPITQDVVRLARAVARSWTNTAERLEQGGLKQ